MSQTLKAHKEFKERVEQIRADTQKTVCELEKQVLGQFKRITLHVISKVGEDYQMGACSYQILEALRRVEAEIKSISVDPKPSSEPPREGAFD